MLYSSDIEEAEITRYSRRSVSPQIQILVIMKLPYFPPFMPYHLLPFLKAHSRKELIPDVDFSVHSTGRLQTKRAKVRGRNRWQPYSKANPPLGHTLSEDIHPQTLHLCRKKSIDIPYSKIVIFGRLLSSTIRLAYILFNLFGTNVRIVFVCVCMCVRERKG